MIPLQLTLKNFLSYRETSLDFRGLHTACICGANGAGKSSLLEAITWVVWGQSRTATEDDVIHTGATNVRVDFEFVSNNQTYRIIRSRQRGKSSSLDFQIKTSSGYFRSLTAKGLRVTQQEIVTNLKLDYDTFINSAYLRQGRADEFMLRRPTERKQILADLLKLDRYEELADRAKDLSKQLKGQAEQLEQSLVPIQAQLEQKDSIEQEKDRLEKNLEQLKQEQESVWQKLQQLQAIEHQRQAWQQQIALQELQSQNLAQDCDRCSKDIELVEHQLSELQQLFDQENEINSGYQQLIYLQKEEESLSAKFQLDRDLQNQKQQLEQQLIQQSNELNLQISQAQTRLEALQQQELDIQQILNNTTEIEAGVEKLNRHRQHLKELDKLQQEVSPLLHQRQHLQTDMERSEARLTAKLEQLKEQEQQFSNQMKKVPEMRKSALAVCTEIGELDKKKIYQQRVKEKGTEKRDYQHKLQEKQRVCEQQLEELKQKLQMLQTPDANCPLCEQELDEKYRHRVIQKTQNQYQEIEQQIWIIRDQIAECERDLQTLIEEHKQLDRDISPYNTLQQELGQLEAKLEATEEINDRLQQIQSEVEGLERSLVIGNYAQELNLELKSLEQQLQNLNYDEQTHALVRGEVERWRWAEIKQAKIEDAKRRQAAIERQQPEIIAALNELQNSLASLQQNSQLKQQINRIDRDLIALNYDRSSHQNLLNSLRQAQSWQLKYQELQQAKQKYPAIRSRLQELEQLLQVKLQDRVNSQEQLNKLIREREKFGDNRAEIQALELDIQQRRQKLDEYISQQGRLEQLLQQIENLQNQIETNRQQLKQVRKKQLIYQELGQAFGKNGIQALMIENVLPQLEAETNHILARLTGNQLHVQFITQRTGKGSSKQQSSKLIDTLDIAIADTKGTRPYETYSGGEAFRINFAIRLALARLLAQRAGTSLQILIVDEGFGTQDADGCDKLVAAINAISTDFACILAVTHMPQFKEAFQTRIEVHKTNQGSHLSIST